MSFCANLNKLRCLKIAEKLFYFLFKHLALQLLLFFTNDTSERFCTQESRKGYKCFLTSSFRRIFAHTRKTDGKSGTNFLTHIFRCARFCILMYFKDVILRQNG